MTDRTHGPFKVGDVCVVEKRDSPTHGKECVITGPLIEKTWRNFWTNEIEFGLAHDVCGEWKPENREWAFRPEFLRLRPPKSDQSQWIREATTTWDKCAWQPSKERA